MNERNEFLESDGLYWESETHEWFHDKTSTDYAHKPSVLWGSGTQKDELKNIQCFVVREKSNGKYDRVVMDSKTNEIVFTSLEDVGGFIDRLKIIKRFE